MKSSHIWLRPILCYADPQLSLRDHQSPGSNRGAGVSPAARECYRDSRQPHPGGCRYVTMAYNPSLRYCTFVTAAVRYCHVPAVHCDQSFLRSLPSTAQQIISRWTCVCVCVFVISRWHGVPACYSRHSSGPGGNTGSFSRDNTRPKQSGSTSRFVAALRMFDKKIGGIHEPSHDNLDVSK